MAEVIVTGDNFNEEVLQSELPVLVDFWAAWCGPCKMLSPVVAQLAEEEEGKIKVCKINVDDEPELARRFRVRSIPTLLVFRNGELVDQSMGYQSLEELKELLS
ncbi:MAG: thioredoxin [Lachnospiraceae bacterium]|nr:thioredoxin [Lachnospiraceae bacterium]